VQKAEDRIGKTTQGVLWRDKLEVGFAS